MKVTMSKTQYPHTTEYFEMMIDVLDDSGSIENVQAAFSKLMSSPHVFEVEALFRLLATSENDAAAAGVLPLLAVLLTVD